jgi:glycerophosphoryl diester phosphodiesterase
MSRIPLYPGIPRPLVFAHRGLSSLAPENTMAAFSLARETGIPGVELDVHLTSDGKLAVIHDHTTARVSTGASLEIERSTWKELSSVDVGSWKGSEWKGERIIELAQLFEEFGDSLYYDVEIKSNVASDYGLEKALASCLRDAFASRGGLAGRILVSSFNPMALARFKYLSPALPTAIIWSSDAEVPAYLRHGEGRWVGKVDVLKPDKAKVRRASSFRWRRFGRYPILPWTVDDKGEAARLLGLGCEGIISNRPQELEIKQKGK